MQTLVSKSSFGAIGNDYSTYCDISADGRLVTFRSGASNLVIADANGVYDQFVHDLQTGITTRVSLSSTGIEANGSVHNECAISADGQIVAFASFADNLVSGDSNGKWDVFTHNRSNGATTRVSVHTLGTQGNWDSFFPRLSADGRYVVYQSSADNLVAGDSNGAIDCFLHDRVPDQTFRVSLNQSNGQIAQHCSRPSISANARYITFSSLDGSIVSGDTNGAIDVFLRDRASASAINTILLLGPSQAAVGEIVRFEWFAAPPNSTYYFAYSFVATGSIISGHTFDLVSPTMLGSGLNSNFGGGFYLSNPLPPAAAGLTVYLEVAASTGIGLEDSYPRSLTIY
ncbi:MAG: PD40 domain-containing protein [Planctomycetes bacterium]|nr:PD40 domain-containing protein [Planctomycetota bacterium]